VKSQQKSTQYSTNRT